MPTSDEDVQTLQESVASKRAELREARGNRVAKERDLTNDIAAAQLKAEEARLDAEIAAEKARSSDEAVTEGAASSLAQAKEEMERHLAVEAPKDADKKAASKTATDSEGK